MRAYVLRAEQDDVQAVPVRSLRAHNACVRLLVLQAVSQRLQPSPNQSPLSAALFANNILRQQPFQSFVRSQQQQLISQPLVTAMAAAAAAAEATSTSTSGAVYSARHWPRRRS